MKGHYLLLIYKKTETGGSKAALRIALENKINVMLRLIKKRGERERKKKRGGGGGGEEKEIVTQLR